MATLNWTRNMVDSSVSPCLIKQVAIIRIILYSFSGRCHTLMITISYVIRKNPANPIIMTTGIDKAGIFS